MPAGDAMRVWFPEVVEQFCQEWSSSLSWEEILQLRERLEASIRSIRTERKIRTAMMYCRNCQKRHPAAEPRISVRAMLFAAQRYGLATETEMKALEKEWARYRAAHGLDRHGEAPRVR